MKIAKLFLLGVGLSTIGACHEPFSNDDIAFLKSLPNRQLVRFAIPGVESGAGTNASGLSPSQEVGTKRAEFYILAKNISTQFNQGILYILNLVDTITDKPPTTREDDVRAWGPIRDGDKEFVLFIARKTDTATVGTVRRGEVEVDLRFEYLMRGRKNGGEWLNLFGGVFAPIGEDGRGVGGLFVNFEAARQVTDANDRGIFAVAYDTRDAGVRLELVLDYPEMGVKPFAEPNSFYGFTLDAERNVEFRYAALVDINENDPTKNQLETLVALARWRNDNWGRADVYLANGDLPFPVGAAECWNESFLRVYFETSIPEQWPTEGSVANCAPEHQVPIDPNEL